MSCKRNASESLEDSVDPPLTPKHIRSATSEEAVNSAKAEGLLEDVAPEDLQSTALTTQITESTFNLDLVEDTFTTAQHAEMDKCAVNEPSLRFFYDVMVESPTMAVAFCAVLLQGIVNTCQGMDPSYYTSSPAVQSRALRSVVEYHEWLRTLLRQCWENGEGYRRVRLLKILRPYEPPIDPDRKAIMNSWSADFKGNAALLLLDTISAYMRHRSNAYSRHASLVNSSGTGKSRMVDELAKSVVVIPMCLRKYGTTGFPPGDYNLRHWLTTGSQIPVQMYAFVCALLTVTLARLKALVEEKGMSINEERLHLGDAGYAEEVICWQAALASQFRDLMTAHQTFENPNNYRRDFYEDVLAAADDHLRKERYGGKVTRDIDRIGQELAEYISPNVFKLQRPLVVISFDEAHCLAETASVQRSPYSELCRVFEQLEPLPIFSLFLSTAGIFRSFHPSEATLHSTDRVFNNDLCLLPPITVTGFDQLAMMSTEGQTLETVTTIEFMCHLGRPLFGSRWDGAPQWSAVRNTTLDLAQAKLTCKPLGRPAKENEILACLAVRLALEFRSTNDSQHQVERLQVEQHMRICISAAPGFESMTTVAASEPLLAEAAFKETRDRDGRWPQAARHLAHHLDVSGVDRGDRGELVAMLLLMQARDVAAFKTYGGRIVTVQAFMEALLPNGAGNQLLSAMPTYSQETAHKTFAKTFEKSRIWFNHFIRVYDFDIINVNNLWKLAVRGAAVLCHTNQRGIDILIPFVCSGTTLARQNMSAILVRIKTDKLFGVEIQQHEFKNMDPFRIGMFSKGAQSPLPVIRMILALGSKRSGWQIAEPRQSRSTREGTVATAESGTAKSKFTAFDLWLAGISSNTFGPVQSDEEESDYRKVLQHPTAITDAYNPRHNRWLSSSSDLAEARTYMRQSMNPASQVGKGFFSKFVVGDSDVQLPSEKAEDTRNGGRG